MEQRRQRQRKLFGQDKYRWATFGGANTYGLGSHLKRRFDAFPFLLSESVENYGSITRGVNYNAVCLQSIITDEYMYDIFLIDFGHAVDESLLHLVKRLRIRFPDALIIFVKYWRPLHISRVDPSTMERSKLLAWMKERNLSNWISDDFKSAILADTGIWYDDREYEGGMADMVEEYASFVDGHIVSLADISDNVTQGLVKYGSLFAHPTLLSEEGHQLMADNVKAFVNSQVINTSDAHHGSWLGGDACHMWFTDGGCEISFGDTASLVEYDVHHGKFALEFSTKGTFIFTNHFEDERELYLSYVVSSTVGIYPDVLLEFGDNHHKVLPGKYNYPSPASEYAVTIPVGMMSPGTHTVTITPYSFERNVKPFRMVGVTFSNGITIPDEYNFAPLFAQ